MTMTRVWVIAVAMTVGCTLDPDGPGGGFGTGGAAGADDEDDDAGDPDDGVDDGGDDATDGAGDDGAADDGAADDGADDGASGGNDAADDAGDGSSGGGDGGDSAGDDGEAGGLAECSNFTSIDQMLTFVNAERGKYGGLFGGPAHIRYKGLPWQGESHEAFTFPVQFTWDDDLAALAQAEADAIAAGASPRGNQQNGTNGLPICQMAPMWIHGLNSSDWRISFAEQPSHWMQTEYASCPSQTFALTPDNQHARMGLHYHDFGGDGPTITRLGIGAAVIPDDGTDECTVWWVLQFGS